LPYKDKEKQREYLRRHYQENKDTYKATTRKNRDGRKDWFAELKKKYCCVDCLESDPDCLDFHHVEDKSFSLVNAVRFGYSEENILRELEKCECLCANCHRYRHSEEWTGGAEGSNWREARLFVWQQKKGRTCSECGEERWQCLDFHHRDQSDKKESISDMARGGYSLETLLREIEKCDLTCANCHRRHHKGNRWNESGDIA